MKLVALFFVLGYDDFSRAYCVIVFLIYTIWGYFKLFILILTAPSTFYLPHYKKNLTPENIFFLLRYNLWLHIYSMLSYVLRLAGSTSLNSISNSYHSINLYHVRYNWVGCVVCRGDDDRARARVGGPRHRLHGHEPRLQPQPRRLHHRHSQREHHWQVSLIIT